MEATPSSEERRNSLHFFWSLVSMCRHAREWADTRLHHFGLADPIPDIQRDLSTAEDRSFIHPSL